jgi:FlaA1/EpsC-like NDP-sugar epimerase
MNAENNKIGVIVVGAGKAGELIANDIRNHDDSGLHVIGFVDDDPSKQGSDIDGVPILGLIADLPKLVKDKKVEELIIALPSERGKTIRNIVDCTIGLGLVYKILPRLAEVLMQDFDKDYLKYVRRVKAEDLLGGEILKSDQAEISQYANNQTILVTGAAGSIGSELCRQIVAHGAKKVIMYDWWENGMFDLRNQLIEDYPHSDLVFIVGDVKNRTRLSQIMSLYKPTTIFHAAAYKHVPLMESNPAEAIRNNIIGTKTVAETAIKYDVKKFVLISTDKAVNPTNIMGATKRAAEKAIHILSQSQSNTIFCAVRFGNVINSNGSAIPFFEKQIEKGGPVTVTHIDINRFFMTIPEAVHLILQAWVMGQNNDLFVLDMGESVKIYDLARLLIALHGYTPDEEIKIKIVGLRPGEKLYEEVLVKEEETLSTPVKKIFRTQNYLNFDKLAFLLNLTGLCELVEEDSLSVGPIKEKMKKMISTYKPASDN